MKESTGNIWDMEADAICITTNGFVKSNGKLVMGAGTAGQAQARFPWLPQAWGREVKQGGNRVFDTMIGTDPITTLIAFPVKHVWYENADLELIEKSAHELMALIEKMGYEKVLLPRPGCGNGRLEWEDVKKVIEPILDDRVVVVSHS